VGSWLATTATRESLRVLRGRAREQVVDVTDESGPLGAAVSDPDDAEVSPGRRVLDAERDRQVRAALAAVPPRCGRLLRLLSAEPPLSYTEIGAALDMPAGSIGPTRGRCLACLRRELARTTAPRPHPQPRVPPAVLARGLPRA
jgi:DNA-directed RNA polymerase specialized sigma24 family protein